MLELFSAVYLLLPAMIFVIGWLKPLIAIPVIILLLYAFWVFKSNIQPEVSSSAPIKVSKKTVLIIFAIICWVVYSGVGGFVWQNAWDHKFRNALFSDLVSKPWPVIEGNSGLCYYIGFWMPAALCGKLFNIEVGYFFQTIWACIGVLLSVFLVFKYVGAQKFRILILFVFFSGLDVLLYISKGVVSGQTLLSLMISLFAGQHIELTAYYFNSSSNTTLIFWLYNQIVPFWVGFMTILTQKKNKGIFFILVLMLFFCPFPCVTLIPVVAFLYFMHQVHINKLNNSFWAIIKKFLSVENLCLIPVAFVLAMYYASNIAVSKISVLQLSVKTIVIFAVSFICEFGLYLLFVYLENKKDAILNMLIISTVVCSFIVMGNSYDFAWRTCIPLAFYIMLLLAKKISLISVRSTTAALLITILLLGAVTPVTEFIRTARNEVLVLQGEASARSDSLPTVFTHENNECYDNFIGDRESFFFNYLGK